VSKLNLKFWWKNSTIFFLVLLAGQLNEQDPFGPSRYAFEQALDILEGLIIRPNLRIAEIKAVGLSTLMKLHLFQLSDWKSMIKLSPGVAISSGASKDLGTGIHCAVKSSSKIEGDDNLLAF